MRVKRLTLILALALASAPGLWVRTPAEEAMTRTAHLTRLTVDGARAGPLVIEGAWQIDSIDPDFGGYSALLARPGGALLAASDTGRLLVIPRATGAPGPAVLDPFIRSGRGSKFDFDIESLARDPAAERLWLGFEVSNAIRRYGVADPAVAGSGLVLEAEAQPAAMRGWRGNSGPEAMARLADGRFVVIEEGRRSGGHRAVLFSGDPTQPETTAIAFRFAGFEDYRPVDLTLLPDGRVLILMRRVEWRLPPGFSSAILIADPAEIGGGETWRGTLLARIEPPLPSDNFEGIAFETGADGTGHVWLISDDNFMPTQRTLLLHLRWEGFSRRERQRARGSTARP